MDQMNQLMASISERFEQKFKTNETLKQEISEQVDLVMRESTKELQDNFEGIVKQNERTLEQM